MKKFSQVFLVLMTTLGFAQCEITGKSNIFQGDKETYAINGVDAQCKQCHHWTTQGNAVITTDNRLSSVSINPQKAGTSTLSVTYLSDTGLAKCQKEITIAPKEGTEKVAATTTEKKKSDNCDVEVTNYEEVAITKNRVALRTNSGEGYTYYWEVVYKNGQKLTSSDKSPQFSYTLENHIVKTSVTVYSKTCHKKFTKSYNEKFWKFF